MRPCAEQSWLTTKKNSRERDYSCEQYRGWEEDLTALTPSEEIDSSELALHLGSA